MQRMCTYILSDQPARGTVHRPPQPSDRSQQADCSCRRGSSRRTSSAYAAAAHICTGTAWGSPRPHRRQDGDCAPFSGANRTKQTNKQPRISAKRTRWPAAVAAGCGGVRVSFVATRDAAVAQAYALPPANVLARTPFADLSRAVRVAFGPFRCNAQAWCCCVQRL